MTTKTVSSAPMSAFIASHLVKRELMAESLIDAQKFWLIAGVVD